MEGAYCLLADRPDDSPPPSRATSRSAPGTRDAGIPAGWPL